MTDFLSDQSVMLAEYFFLLQQNSGALIPPRSAFNPSDIPRLLPNMVIFELKSDEECLFRLVGTAGVDRAGFNAQGQNYFKMFPENIRRACARNMNCLFTQPCGSIGLQIETYANGETATVEAVSFPFLDNAGNRLIIAAATEVNTDKLTLPGQGEVALDRWPEHRFLDIGAGIPA